MGIYESQMRELARGAIAAHGQLEEVVFLEANKDSLLVFSDGTVLDVRAPHIEREYYAYQMAQELGGTNPFSLLTFGYSGTGPSCYSAFLSAAGFQSTGVVDIVTPLKLRPDGSKVRGIKADGSIEWEDGSKTPGMHVSLKGGEKEFQRKPETAYPVSPTKALECTFLRTLTGHTKPVHCIAISPDGQILASGSADQTIKLWNLHTGEMLHTIEGHANDVTCVAIGPDGYLLASGSKDKTIKLWNLHTGELLRTLEGHRGWLSSVSSLALSPDGRLLASGGNDNKIKLWYLQTGELLRTLEGHKNYVDAIAISPDGKTLVSGSRDRKIKLWNLQSGELLRTLEGHRNWVYCVAINPYGQTFASGSQDNTIKLWNLHTGELVRTFTGHTNAIRSVAISPDGQTLASGSDDKTIKLWNLRTGEVLRSLEGHRGWLYSVSSVAISPDGQTLVSGSHDQTIKIWSMYQPLPEKYAGYPGAAAEESEKIRGTTSFYEKDNIGDRHDSLSKAVAYWMGERFRSPKKDPFVMYTFDTAEDAEAALLELPCIHVAEDSHKLICTEVLIFGYYPTSEGKYEAVVCGDDLTHELWEQARESFAKHGGRRKNDQEPEKKMASATTSTLAEPEKVVFVREDKEDKEKQPHNIFVVSQGGVHEPGSGDVGTYLIYKGPNAASAKAFLQAHPVTQQFVYLVVETPEGNYCRDIQGIYKESGRDQTLSENGNIEERSIATNRPNAEM